MAGLRLMLGVEVRAGFDHSAVHSQPSLLGLLDGLPEWRKPQLVRGDNVFGNVAMTRALEARHQLYLFKLKLTKNTKRHIGRLLHEPGWLPAGQGWESKEGELALTGWESKRRVVVLRRSLTRDIVLTTEQDGQQILAYVEADRKADKAITSRS